MTLEKIQIAIAVVAIGCGVLSFAVYFFLSLRPPTQAAAKNANDAAEMVRARAAVTPAEVTDLVKALAALGESLAKAGPALWSMIGSALFLLIAAISVGVLQGKPEAAPQAQGAGASSSGRTLGGEPAVAGAPQTPPTPQEKLDVNSRHQP